MVEGHRSSMMVRARNGVGRGLDDLPTLIDHLTAAQTIADARGEAFLSYMLAMAIQAARESLTARGLI